MSELDYRKILASLADAVVAADRHDRIVYVNAAAERLLGWPPGALIGRSLPEIMPERLRPAHLAGFSRFLATGTPRLVGRAVRVPAVRRDGAEIDIELTLSVVDAEPGSPVFVGSLRDLRERVELEREKVDLETAQRRLAAQYEVTSAVASAGSLTDVAPRILRAIGENLGWEVGTLWTVDSAAGLLRAASVWHSAHPGTAAFVEVSRRTTFRPGEGRPGTTWATGKPDWIADASEDPRFVRAQAAAAAGLHAAFWFPVRCAGRVSHVLEFISKRMQTLDAPLVRTMDTLAGQIGQYLERCAAQAALQEREEWLSTTLRSIGDAVVACDTAGHVTFMNPIAEALTGWSQDEARGAALDRVLHLTDERTGARLESPAARVLREEAAAAGARRLVLRARDGTETAIAESGAPIRNARDQLLGAVLVFRDETAARRQEQHQQLLAEAGALLVAPLEYEAALARLCQLAVRAVADWCAIEVLAPEPDAAPELIVAHAEADREPLVRALYGDGGRGGEARQDALRPAQPALYTETCEALLDALDPVQRAALSALGQPSIVAVPLLARGRPLGSLALGRARPRRPFETVDLALATELGRRAAAAVDTARLYRETQQAVRARDEFLSVASHELRTPLTSLQLHVQSITRNLRSAAWAERVPRDRLADAAASIARQTERLARLVADLLDVSRITGQRLALELEQVDLADVVREVAARFAAEAERARCPLVVRADAPALGRWDRLRLDQVATNLLSNALKYGAGRPVEVRIEGDEATARLVVRDEGIGVPREHQARIFERFERAVSVRNYGGLGLGLWIARQLVEALGGTIRVASEPGRGSTFTVELPRRGPSDAPQA